MYQNMAIGSDHEYPQIVSLTLPTIGQYLVRISCSLKNGQQ